MERYSAKELSEIIYKFIADPWDDASPEEIEKEINENPIEVINYIINRVVEV